MTNAEKAKQFDFVMDELLDTVSKFEGKAGAGLVAYGLLTLGCQLAHDYCPDDQDWMELVNHVLSNVDTDKSSTNSGYVEEPEGVN